MGPINMPVAAGMPINVVGTGMQPNDPNIVDAGMQPNDSSYVVLRHEEQILAPSETDPETSREELEERFLDVDGNDVLG